MALEIFWTKRSQNSFHDTVNYLEDEWGNSSAKKFIKKVKHFIEIVEKNPDIGKIELEDKGIRGFVISRQITVFYRKKKNRIILLKFFDTRQHPGKRIR